MTEELVSRRPARASQPKSARLLGIALSSFAHAGAAAALILALEQAPVPLGSVEIAVELDGAAQSSEVPGTGDPATDSDGVTEQAAPADTLPREAPQPVPTDAMPDQILRPEVMTSERMELPSTESAPPKQPTADVVQPRQPPVKHSRDDRDEHRTASRRHERASANNDRGQGRPAGTSTAGGMSRASYAALVVAQIQARKFYPAGGAGGIVAFSLAIGPAGIVTSFRITRSSGSGALDQAARQIVTSIHPPPPPGGSFSGTATLRFDMPR